MKTPFIIGATVVGTVAVFSAGGLVALSFMKSMMPETQTVVAAPAPVAVPAPAPVVAQAPVAVVDPAPVAPQAEPESKIAVLEVEPEIRVPSTDEIIQQLMASGSELAPQKDVVIYDFVSASQSATQFDSAIPERLKNSIVSALDNGKSVAELGQMVQSAVDLGLVEAPAALSTADGKPDARAILLAIVNQHEAETGKTFAKTTLGIEAPVDTNGRNVTYVVEQGDSLAYLALKFYGNTAEYRVIFNANRSKIERPDAIRIGQRLIIPAI